MANILIKAISILAKNLNSGLSYLITTVPTLGDNVQEVQGLLQGIGKKSVHSELGTGFSQTGCVN